MYLFDVTWASLGPALTRLEVTQETLTSKSTTHLKNRSVARASVFTQGIYGTFFDLGFKVQILDYYMNN